MEEAEGILSLDSSRSPIYQKGTSPRTRAPLGVVVGNTRPQYKTITMGACMLQMHSSFIEGMLSPADVCAQANTVGFLVYFNVS